MKGTAEGITRNEKRETYWSSSFWRRGTVYECSSSRARFSPTADGNVGAVSNRQHETKRRWKERSGKKRVRKLILGVFKSLVRWAGFIVRSWNSTQAINWIHLYTGLRLRAAQFHWSNFLYIFCFFRYMSQIPYNSNKFKYYVEVSFWSLYFRQYFF